MKTKEGDVKKLVQEMLRMYGIFPAKEMDLALDPVVFPTGWYFMPVSIGMGVHGIPDFIGHYHGQFFAIETKADEKKNPTKLQQKQMDAIFRSGGAVFLIRSEKELKDFEKSFLEGYNA